MNNEISEKNLILHEFIGLHATVVASSSKNLENVSGIIIDETKNTFKIECKIRGTSKVITVPKHKTKFQITLASNKINGPKKTLEVDGSILTKRPEDRIKKLAKLAYKKNRNPN